MTEPASLCTRTDPSCAMPAAGGWVESDLRPACGLPPVIARIPDLAEPAAPGGDAEGASQRRLLGRTPALLILSLGGLLLLLLAILPSLGLLGGSSRETASAEPGPAAHAKPTTPTAAPEQVAVSPAVPAEVPAMRREAPRPDAARSALAEAAEALSRPSAGRPEAASGDRRPAELAAAAVPQPSAARPSPAPPPLAKNDPIPNWAVQAYPDTANPQGPHPQWLTDAQARLATRTPRDPLNARQAAGLSASGGMQAPWAAAGAAGPVPGDSGTRPASYQAPTPGPAVDPYASAAAPGGQEPDTARFEGTIEGPNYQNSHDYHRSSIR